MNVLLVFIRLVVLVRGLPIRIHNCVRFVATEDPSTTVVLDATNPVLLALEAPSQTPKLAQFVEMAVRRINVPLGTFRVARPARDSQPLTFKLAQFVEMVVPVIIVVWATTPRVLFVTDKEPSTPKRVKLVPLEVLPTTVVRVVTSPVQFVLDSIPWTAKLVPRAQTEVPCTIAVLAITSPELLAPVSVSPILKPVLPVATGLLPMFVQPEVTNWELPVLELLPLIHKLVCLASTVGLTTPVPRAPSRLE